MAAFAYLMRASPGTTDCIESCPPRGTSWTVIILGDSEVRAKFSVKIGPCIYVSLSPSPPLPSLSLSPTP